MIIWIAYGRRDCGAMKIDNVLLIVVSDLPEATCSSRPQMAVFEAVVGVFGVLGGLGIRPIAIRHPRRALSWLY